MFPFLDWPGTEVGSRHQTTSISSTERVSSLEISANEMHSWDWQAAVVQGEYMPVCLSWQAWEAKERKPENCSRIRSDGPKPASQHWVPRGQEGRLRCKFHTDRQVRHQWGWRGRFICTSTSLSSSPLAPAEPTLSALFPLLNPSVLWISSPPAPQT